MIRLSVSDLESYRYWKENESATVDELIVKLAHLEPPTPNMEAGRAFAKFWEHANFGQTDIVEVDGWTFDFSEVEATLQIAPARELKGEVLFDTPSGPVTLVGKVDGTSGLTVYDQKLTERFDAERYLDSLQWRAYLSMFNGSRFIYDVFTCKYSGHLVTVNGYERLAFYAYPGMHEHIRTAVVELASVVKRYLTPELIARAQMGPVARDLDDALKASLKDVRT
jgi:hypothetical protein